MMAHNIDLFFDHEMATAIADPKLTPLLITVCWIGYGVACCANATVDIVKIMIKLSKKLSFFMNITPSVWNKNSINKFIHKC